MSGGRLSRGDLRLLERLATPTVYNGWREITRHDIARGCCNAEDVRDYAPELGAMAGYAVTCVIQPGEPGHGDGWSDYRRYVAGVPGPKVVVVQDLDKPAAFGSMWGEVNATLHRALDCRGCIVDGAVRDVDEMRGVGFKALARRLCVGNAHARPIRWGCPVEVFGITVRPGQLIHADRHGFLAVPEADEAGLLAAAQWQDANETATMIAAGLDGGSPEALCDAIDAAAERFGRASRERFGGGGEWA